MTDLDAHLQKRINNAKQTHLIIQFERCTDEEKKQLKNELKMIEFEKLSEFLSAAMKTTVFNHSHLMCPRPSLLSHACSLQTYHPTVYEKYKDFGTTAIKEGKVAVILLAGGQGTRLGWNHPKGMYDINLPSHSSLFQMQAERLLSLCNSVSLQLNRQFFIPWYIMTSEQTNDETIDFFEKHNYFNYDKNSVIFFMQFKIPVFTKEKKIMMNSKNSICWSPEGNGGIYRALQEGGILNDMRSKGIEYVHIYGVDNVLACIADPVFIGFSIYKDSECCVKVIERKNPHEQIGVIGVVDEQFRVIEYSELSNFLSTQLLPIPEKLACKLTEPRLLYSLGNICNHLMTVQFLEKVCSMNETWNLPYHIAQKTIPYFDVATNCTIEPVEPNALKLEKFIFDVFPFASKFSIWEVERTKEFSPLKNGFEATTDNPQSCRSAILKLHTNWALKAGAILSSNDTEKDYVEISPLVSLSGEGLEFLNGKTINGANIVIRDDTTLLPILKCLSE